ncbi:hypothetical protein P879_02001 [Paragonimus westermani]|uniref:Secreted protein n=1 Tax=Paragonimus westermani TaxID=34504 RepID=A0A8T0DMN4_9TREM|nr:hypothetical protein P879_02001 [Paragonimus westermani]
MRHGCAALLSFTLQLLLMQQTPAYIKLKYPDYCFYDAVRFHEDSGFFFYLNPITKLEYKLTEATLLSTNTMRLDFGFSCSIILHGMRDPMRPWVLCCKLY